MAIAASSPTAKRCEQSSGMLQGSALKLAGSVGRLTIGSMVVCPARITSAKNVGCSGTCMLSAPTLCATFAPSMGTWQGTAPNEAKPMLLAVLQLGLAVAAVVALQLHQQQQVLQARGQSSSKTRSSGVPG